MAATIIKAENIGNDVVRITGTVNGNPVVTVGWMSALTGMTAAQKLAYGKSLLIAAVPPDPIDLGIAG